MSYALLRSPLHEALIVADNLLAVADNLLAVADNLLAAAGSLLVADNLPVVDSSLAGFQAAGSFEHCNYRLAVDSSAVRYLIFDSLYAGSPVAYWPLCLNP